MRRSLLAPTSFPGRRETLGTRMFSRLALMPEIAPIHAFLSLPRRICYSSWTDPVPPFWLHSKTDELTPAPPPQFLRRQCYFGSSPFPFPIRCPEQCIFRDVTLVLSQISPIQGQFLLVNSVFLFTNVPFFDIEIFLCFCFFI